MSAITPTIVRAGLRRSIQVNAIASACQKRSTSWIPWEPNWLNQPNMKLTLDLPSEEATSKPEDKKPLAEKPSTPAVRKVGEAVIAPATAAIGAGTQEISISGKTVPPSIQAGSTRIPSTQTRNTHTTSNSGSDGDSDNTPSNTAALVHLLPTTLLRIPDMPSTWPGKTQRHPDQPRVRKQRMALIHSFTSTPQPSPLPTPDVLSHVALFPSLDTDPHPSLTFEKAVARYMDGVKARAEALVYVERFADPDIGRQVLDEVERVQWRRVVWSALENLPGLPGKGDEGEGEKKKGKA
ncbi:hypothetical protein F5B19DRAFT_499450 [Rostrohypoxylon terebratum]|nr:hypothetical protein F5B19DRAFT_499450 [Rostrohypoxylon terebratum]